MALIKCPECGKEISDRAPVCIHCGFPLQDHLNELKTYSVIVSERCDNIDSCSKLCEIANITISTAKDILSSPNSIIMSGLSMQKAHSVSTQLLSAGCKTEIVQDPENQTFNTEKKNFPDNLVLKIKKYKHPRKDRPCIEASWKGSFPDISLFCPRGEWRNIRYYWKNTDNNSLFSQVSLFNFKKNKLDVCRVSEVQCIPKAENIFIWLTPDVQKFTTVPSIFVLGNVDAVPTDELNLTGTISSVEDAFGNAIPVCPRCGSPSIQIVKRGFSGGNAVAGALLLGPVGLAAGAIGSGNIQRICANCGHRF